MALTPEKEAAINILINVYKRRKAREAAKKSEKSENSTEAKRN